VTTAFCPRCQRVVLRVITDTGIAKTVDPAAVDTHDASITDVDEVRARWVPPTERAGVRGRHREHWRTCAGRIRIETEREELP